MLPLPEEMTEGAAFLPDSKKEAGKLARKSDFVKNILSEEIMKVYLR